MNNIIKRVLLATAVLTLGVSATACGQSEAKPAKVKVVRKYDRQPAHQATRIEKSNTRRENELTTARADLNKREAEYAKQTGHGDVAKAATDDAALAKLNYSGQQEITVNDNKPGFSAADLSTAKGAWEAYSNLDSLNRAVAGNALLNVSLMPTVKRTGQTWDPTGWHNRKTRTGWLYNRSHLIGFQLSGENNNPKNLMTGTRSLNSPLMLVHEDDIAYYLKQSDKHYIRYEVRPVYRGNELVARGVHMRAQSVGDNNVSFNVYIFNVEDGYTINYSDGTSTTN
ncbi:DNA/RNA non-specific endonuclease [Lacticaseibacillus pabuli]|uniref:DNA/RNA non-specific endonuclease n=1 Tax=Lacticaseibacillus pabuli TaxID=3025672 RepID=A0ABY7WR01_9LACO|nr:DNA/RNA non-specific endonuclease [Lacticaseibacillus sp. KACC 23028]WDF82619.1 DNA/RNA non-specific endonuclease [Lacticaseibacillus sp. KACC 23028]